MFDNFSYETQDCRGVISNDVKWHMDTAKHQRELIIGLVWQAQKWAVKLGDPAAFSWALTLYLYTLESCNDQELKDLYAQAQAQVYALEDLYMEQERHARYRTVRA